MGTTAIIIVITLMTPLIPSVPEERFGLTFHPFFALGTSYFLHDNFSNVNFKSSGFLKIAFIFIMLVFCMFLLSLNIESTFGLRLNG